MIRYSIHLLSLLVLFSGGLCVHQTAAAADDKGARRERFEMLEKEYDKRNLDLPATAFSKKFLALAKEQPTDEVALDAMVWVIENHDPDEPPTQLDEALKLIGKHHAKSPRLKSLMSFLLDANSTQVLPLLQILAEKGGDRDVRGLASFFVANTQYAMYDGSDEKTLAAIQAQFERVKKDYGNVRLEGSDRTIGKLADTQLYEIKYLQPGKVAPDFEGTSQAGKKLKLSDQRGKVVMLVFWGSWCGPCMAKVPYEKQLMTKYAGRPFTVLGVNSGDPKEVVEKVMADKKMTWPSFVDGELGPIVERWNVNSFPTIYLIDAKGVIRINRMVEDEDLEKAIEAAIKQAESK